MKNTSKIPQQTHRKKSSGLSNERQETRQAELEEASTRLMESDLFKKMPGFTVPIQARTRIKTASIIATAAFMLESKNFSSISIEQIAGSAECSIPSIYARFKDKNALLPAIHLLTIEAIRKRLDDEIYFERFEGQSPDVFYNAFISIIADYFDENRNFVCAAILSEATVVHRQLQALLPVLTTRLNLILLRLLNRNASETEGPVLFGLGLIISLLRDAAVVPAVAGTRDRVALVRLFALVIETGMTG